MALEAQGSNPCIHPGVMPIMGYRQAVRHSTLTAALVGSNPTSPVRAVEKNCSIKYGALAQSVEHLTFNQVVRGSNPRCLTKTYIRDYVGLFHSNADVAELADALDLGSSGKPCRFDSCHPHKASKSKDFGAFFFNSCPKSLMCLMDSNKDSV